jgi:hypothetical protein
MRTEITTSKEKKYLQPEYWTLCYMTDDNQYQREHGFATLNSAMKRLKSIQILSYPSTIQQVELRQIFELEEIDQISQDELAYLDECFMKAMEDNEK